MATPLMSLEIRPGGVPLDAQFTFDRFPCMKNLVSSEAGSVTERSGTERADEGTFTSVYPHVNSQVVTVGEDLLADFTRLLAGPVGRRPGSHGDICRRGHRCGRGRTVCGESDQVGDV